MPSNNLDSFIQLCNYICKIKESKMIEISGVILLVDPVILNSDGAVVRIWVGDNVVDVLHSVRGNISNIPLKRSMLDGVACVHADFVCFIYGSLEVEWRQERRIRTNDGNILLQFLQNSET